MVEFLTVVKNLDSLNAVTLAAKFDDISRLELHHPSAVPAVVEKRCRQRNRAVVGRDYHFTRRLYADMREFREFDKFLLLPGILPGFVQLRRMYQQGTRDRSHILTPL